MISTFVRRLQNFVEFSPRDIEVLNHLSRTGRRELRPGEYLVHEGDPPRELTVFLDGWGIRYKSLQDGRRQILGYFVPGDLCEMGAAITPTMDHSIGILTRTHVVEIARDFMQRLAAENPNIVRAIELDKVAMMANLRETILNLGQRTAVERTAHFLCEMFVRLKSVGLTEEETCRIGMTRVDIADATGMTTVHTSRTIKELRAIGLLDLQGKKLTIPDLDRLKRIALFSPSYLGLRREPDGEV